MIRGNEGDARKASVSYKPLDVAATKRADSLVEIIPSEASVPALPSNDVQTPTETPKQTFQSYIFPEQSSLQAVTDAIPDVRVRSAVSSNLEDTSGPSHAGFPTSAMATVAEKASMSEDTVAVNVATIDKQSCHGIVRKAHDAGSSSSSTLPSSQSVMRKMEEVSPMRPEESFLQSQPSTHDDDKSNNKVYAPGSDPAPVQMSIQFGGGDSASVVNRCDKQLTPSRTAQECSRVVAFHRTIPGGVFSLGVNTNSKPFQENEAGLQFNPSGTAKCNSIKSSTTTPRVKRIKLEHRAPSNDAVANLRKLICDQKLSELNHVKMNYKDHLTELFFHQNGGIMVDYFTWKRRPPAQLMLFLKEHTVESDDEQSSCTENLAALGTTATTTGTAIATLLPKGSGLDNFQESQDGPALSSQSSPTKSLSTAIVADVPDSERSLSTTAPTHVITSSSQIFAVSTNVSPDGAVPAAATETTCSWTSPSCSVNNTPTTNSISSTKAHKPPCAASSPARLQTRQHSISAVYDSSIGSQEEIVERAKQEAFVVQRISDLRKEGLWSEKRLPKVQEPPRTKAHWDYLLEEMVWLATDFAQERKWKKAAAKKCARMCQKYHQEQKLREERAEKEAEQKLRRIASATAKEIKQFWTNVEKLVEYKQRSRLEEKRKKALDLQLNFIVDQTEKYSSWLAQGMNKSFLKSNNTSLVSSARNSRTSSPVQSSRENSEDDIDFQPETSDADDEETIAKEEQVVDEAAQKNEIELLQKESDVPLEELLRSLPKEILDKPASLLPSIKDEDSEMEVDESVKVGDDEFFISSNDSTSDDEQTLEEQEWAEKGIDHTKEIDELQKDGDIPIEDLLEKYADMMMDEEDKKSLSSYAEDADMEGEDSDDESEESQSEEEYPEEYENSEDEEKQESVGLTSLMVLGKESVQDDELKTPQVANSGSNSGPSKEITDIAADAERFQPKGYTYSTAQVETKVPFLLKHQLREYQHIGLDWLVTMQERKLNGILADEMGLGKTIQTIALLGHLACDKGIWGPHLIVVPTSVMLNWEMEFKKWCPAFKILTYYGSQKERKLKRQGWTKPNAFHVCITSYKLVIQDHPSFRRKRWKYFILDEAQNIKNFKSQRWQLLLNFQSQWRLLLTGTPLQNNLMELWSLMHFLMPNVFQSHRDFKEWFANPLSGMIEGSHEYNEGLIKRLHKVLRPFLLRRLKCEVEKQLPRKFEHIIMCRLSKRQRYLYDDFMSQAKTKETLASGNFMSVINVLMQLRKVCNHPNMFEARPTISPFQMRGVCFWTASRSVSALCYDPFKHVNLYSLNLLLADLELSLTAFAAHRIKRFQTPKKLIEEIDSAPEVPPKCPPGKIKLHVRTSSSVPQHVQGASGRASPLASTRQTFASPSPARTVSPMTNAAVANVAGTQMKAVLSSTSSTSATATTVSTSQSQPFSGYTFQLVQQQPQGIPIAQLTPSQVVTSTPITVQIQQTQQGPRITVPAGQLAQIPAGFAQILQTSTGQHILLTSNPQAILQPVSAIQTSSSSTTSSNLVTAHTTPNMISNTTSTVTVPKPQQTVPLNIVNKPVMRVAPMNVSTAITSNSATVNNKITVLSHKPVTPAISHIEEIKDKKVSLPSHSTRSLFYLENIVQKKASQRREKLRLLAKFNTRRCEACPIYGSDLIKALTIVSDLKPVRKTWQGMGYVHCLNATKLQAHPSFYWYQTDTLADIVYTPEKRVNALKNILSRFVFWIPAVTAPSITMHVSHPLPSWLLEQRQREALFQSSLSPLTAIYHCIASGMLTQFPDPRLIQYDCGKLQTLDLLLRKLKTDYHRVLIFTQMTRMLDVLEQFLNYHGHIYLRLDGTTRVEQRQALMERFNADKRIFCFILSTRSGGIGVNLIGADTVIFYDSDWNPTMDAQAQDRCHRIGQTRDVHIYRLISRMTVEENILRKANQKRLLGEVAIEGGNFTTAFFRKQTIKDLFDFNFEEMRREDLKIKKEEPVIKKVEPVIKKVEPVIKKVEPVIKKEEPVIKKEVEEAIDNDKITNAQLEYALAHAEEDMDVQATKTAKAEAAAELAEFDESIPYDGDSKADEEPSKVEEELGMLMAQLTPVERYAMVFLESIQEPFSLEQLKQAEEEIEAQKKDWELGRLQALKEEEERRALMDDDDALYTYSHEDAHNQLYVSYNSQEQMPMWAPPTPPQDENDVYIDYSNCFLYEPSTMAESQLPPIFIKREHKRLRLDNINIARKQKVRKDDAVCLPRSLFDRPTAAVLKMRRDVKLQKIRGIIRSPIMASFKPPTVKTVMDMSQDQPEWLIHEDWALLQAIQTLLELPLNLLVLSPGHTPNWDMVAEVVNSTGRIYRSPKQCKNRYEGVIVPREEGKIMYDANPKKQKKSSKGLCSRVKLSEMKNNRPMRTSQLFVQDNNNSFTQLNHQHFETIKAVANKKTVTLKPLLINPTLKNPKHVAVLSENNINYEQPLTPVQVAAIRAERIAREKQKSQTNILTEQQLHVQRQQQQQQQQPSQAAVAHQVASVNQQGIVGLQSAQQLQSVISVAASSLSSVTTANLSSLCTAQRTASGLAMRNLSVGNSQAVVSLTAAQVQAATQRITAANLAAATSVPTSVVSPTQALMQTSKGLSMQQIQALRTHNLFKQQQQQRLQRMQQHQVQQAAANTTGSQPQTQAQKLGVSAASVSGAGANGLHAAHAQQRGQLPKQIVKPTRAISDADIAQLVKLQQQKNIVGTQVAHMPVSNQGQVATQILTPAQIQQMQQQQVAQSSVASLVKTVATPSVTIPMSAVNLNIPTQVAGKPQLPTQLGTVQIVQQSSPTAAYPAQKQLSAVTVQHIQQVMKQVPQALQQLTQATSAASTSAASVVSQTTSATQQSLMSQQLISKTPQTAVTLTQSSISSTGSGQLHGPSVTSLSTGQTMQARVIPMQQPAVAAGISPSVAATTASGLKQTIQVVTATTATLGQSQIPSAAQIRSHSRVSPSSVSSLESTPRQTSVFNQVPNTATSSSMSGSTSVSAASVASPPQAIAVAVRPAALFKASQLTPTASGTSTITSVLGSPPTVVANLHPNQTNQILLQQNKVQNPAQIRSSAYAMRLRNPPKQ